MQSAAIKLRRKIRWSTVAFFFLSGIVTATWSSRIPEIQLKFHLSDAQWGVVLFALPLGLVTALPLSSWFIAKFSSSKVMTITGMIYTLFLCTLSVANNVWVLAALLFCFGFSRNFYTMAVNTNAIEIQRVYDKPVVATFHGAWSLASLIGISIGTYMISENIHPTIHFIFISLAVAVAIVLNKRLGNSKREARVERKPFFIKPDRYLFILGLISFCVMLCEGTVFDWTINYFDKVVKADKPFVTVGYTAFITTMTLGRLVGDKIISYIGLQKVLLINGMLMAAGFLIAVIFPTVWVAGFGFLLVGLGDSVLVPTLYSLAGKSVKMKPAYSIGSVTMIGYAGFLLGPLIVGGLSQQWGMSSAFVLMAVLCCFISLFSTVLGKTTSG